MKELKKIWNNIKEIVAFVSSLVSIILVFFDAKEYSFWIVLAVVIGLSINGLCVLIPIFRTSRAAKKIQKKYFDKEKRISASIRNYLHRLRDYTSFIESEKNSNKIEYRKSCELLCAEINEIFREICKDVLADDESISICIKTVKAESVSDIHYEQWRLETFGRCPSTKPDRKNLDLDDALLSDNTDFLVIVEGKANYVSFSDMRNIEDAFLKEYKVEYKNSRKNFLDYYRSCIIVPIEIDWENASDNIREKLSLSPNRKLLLGFLCLDSMKIFETDEEIKTFECSIELSRAIGDSLYIFLEKVLLLQMKE